MAKEVGFDDIKVGSEYSLTRTFTEDDVKSFAKVVGDFNPIHIDEKYARETIFKGRIVHGMLSGSLIPAAVARGIPGAIYLRQEFNFLRPVRIGDTVTAKCEIIKKIKSKKHVVLKTTCINQKGLVVIDGITICKVF